MTGCLHVSLKIFTFLIMFNFQYINASIGQNSPTKRMKYLFGIGPRKTDLDQATTRIDTPTADPDILEIRKLKEDISQLKFYLSRRLNVYEKLLVADRLKKQLNKLLQSVEAFKQRQG